MSGRLAAPAGRRIGLLGGSFNPAHEGHLHISRVALRRLKLDEVWWLVSPQNPLKAEDGMAALPHRLAAARAVARHPRIVVTDVERRLGTRYTVDTLAALRRRFPRASFVWLMGADNLIELPKWRRWRTLVRLAPFAVVARPGYVRRARTSAAATALAAWRWPASRAAELPMAEPPAWVFLQERMNPQSATALRAEGRWPGP